MRVTLPWPPLEMSPNARAHWATKARAAGRHKRDCQILCMGVGIRALGWDGMAVSLTFHPPSARRSDLDNMLAAMKAGLDGLAAASGVDDSRWQITIARGEPVKGGAVDVAVSKIEATKGTN